MTEHQRVDRAGDAGVSPERWRQAERETADKVRQAAEELFRPKPGSVPEEPPPGQIPATENGYAQAAYSASDAGCESAGG